MHRRKHVGGGQGRQECRVVPRWLGGGEKEKDASQAKQGKARRANRAGGSRKAWAARAKTVRQTRRSATRKSRRNGANQVSVKMADSMTVVLDVELSETVDEVKRKIRSKWMYADDDEYLTVMDKMLRGSDALRECGVDDGNTVHLTERLRGRRVHKNKQTHGRSEKKRDLNQEGSGSRKARRGKFRLGEIQPRRSVTSSKCFNTFRNMGFRIPSNSCHKGSDEEVEKKVSATISERTQ